jgi:5'-nucleotidase
LVTRRALHWLLDHPHQNVLNVNIPDVPPDRLRGLRPGRLADFGAVQADIGETGEGFVTMTFSEVAAEPAPDTDVALLREVWATITALRAPCEDGNADLPTSTETVRAAQAIEPATTLSG